MSWANVAWSGRRGFTSIKLLVVIAIIGVLIAFWWSALHPADGPYLVGPSAASGADAAPKSEVRSRAAIAAWDTAKPSAEALAPSALAEKSGWISVPLQKTVESFKGDAVLSNGRILIVARKQDMAVEVYSFGPEGAVARARLLLHAASGEPAANLDRVSLVENAKGAGCLEVFYKTAKGAGITAKFRIKKGDVFVQAEPGTSAGRLRVECPSPFVVLPDFFADDIMIAARRILLAATEVPSDNFLLHMTGKGDAIAMCVFEGRQQDVKVTLAGAGEKRTITGSEIDFEDKKIWVAVLEGKQIWHAVDVKADAEGIVPLGWKMPFVAQWRVDFTRTNDLTDSWPLLLQEKKGGDYSKPSWLASEVAQLNVNLNKKRSPTELDSPPYPCWSDHERRGYWQHMENSEDLKFLGPTVLYPLTRVKQTPLDAFTVVDIMRNTLGVGPCEHILDVEGLKFEYKGRATCGVRDLLGPIYQQNQQKQKRAEVDKILNDGLIFVTHIRGRITRYVEFGHKMRAYLAEQKKIHPETGEFLTETDKLVQKIDARVAARASKIKTLAHVAEMNKNFRKDVLDYEGPDALEKCTKYTKALVEIGSNQDELVMECRFVVKSLRQRAALLMALDPKVSKIAKEIRAKTQEVLRNPAHHESYDK